MTRSLFVCSFVAVVASGAWSPAAAQTSGDSWDVLVAPYLLGAAMDGTTTMRGRVVDVDASASDIFSNLQFGAMGVVIARKGNWGFGGDLIWMSLGTTVRNTNVDFNQGAFAFYGLRRLGPGVDFTFGLRMNTLQGNLTLKSVGVDGFAVNQNKIWVDPLAGVTLRTAPNRPLQLRIYGEVGGFGAGSDFTWQIFPTVGIEFTHGVSLEIGYRWLDIDYKTDSRDQQFAYDVLTQGPVVGLGFRF